jgi:RHS repeat-associated protein
MSYAYDALGRRISKTVQGGTPTQFLYDGPNAVQEMQGSTINPILVGLGIDERFARNDTTGRTYFLTDALNSTLALTNSSGAIQNTYSYDPYGNTTQSNASFTNPYQYTGREADTPGLYYYRARYYSPPIGGMISEDPIGFGGGQSSFYAYVGGDPLSNTDLSGLQEDTVSAYCGKYGAAACTDAVGQSQATGSVASKAAAVGGAALGIAATLTGDSDPDDCGCGPDSRIEAYEKALAWAGMSIGNEGNPIPWSQYRGATGRNYAYVRANGGNNYGYYSESWGSPAEVLNHPDGHPDQVGPGYPAYHQCPHFHARNDKGQEAIFPYLPGT